MLVKADFMISWMDLTLNYFFLIEPPWHISIISPCIISSVGNPRDGHEAWQCAENMECSLVQKESTSSLAWFIALTWNRSHSPLHLVHSTRQSWRLSIIASHNYLMMLSLLNNAPSPFLLLYPFEIEWTTFQKKVIKKVGDVFYNKKQLVLSVNVRTQIIWHDPSHYSLLWLWVHYYQ